MRRLRDWPTLGWLALAGMVSLVHREVPQPRWLLVHLVLLGALTHAALVWSKHFADTLLKDRVADERPHTTRIAALLVGSVTVAVGYPLDRWWVVLAGATVVALAVLWHGLDLARRLRKALPGRFRIVIRFYIAAALVAPIGVTFAVLLARPLGDAWHARLLLAHSLTMLLGWVGLTVTGTLTTLWPTVLRARMDERAERFARQSLPVLLLGLALIDIGALLGWRWLLLAGLLVAAAGLAWWARMLPAPWRAHPPEHFAALSIAAALGWWVVGLVLIGWLSLRADPVTLANQYGWVGAIVAVGFAAQLLFGALSWLVPVSLGGGTRGVRAAQRWFDHLGELRLVVANGGLLLCLAPVPSWVRVIVSVLVLIALLAWLPLLGLAVRDALRARGIERGSEPLAPESVAIGWKQAIAGMLVLALGVAGGIAVDPAAAGVGSSRVDDANAPVVRVTVTAQHMRYEPSSIEVPAGSRLVVTLVNNDPGMSHDLWLPGGATRRLATGEQAALDAGVITESTQGWCTVAGHKQMGMILDVVVSGHGHATGAAAAPAGSAVRPDLTFPDSFTAVPATLGPAPAGRVHRVTLTVREVELEVAPGIRQKRWTYNNSAPAPTLHGKVGDIFDVTLINEGSMGHSVDFHASQVDPQSAMRTIQPGERLRYRFRAERSGIWMYHCSTMPMTAHIAAGMAGAVIIEPDDLPTVDRSFVLVQSEAYVAGDGRTRIAEVDGQAIADERPTFVTFNGIANQYDARPLAVRKGERVRIWVLNAGPNRSSSFHIVGEQFDTVYLEGTYLLRNGRGALDSAGTTTSGSQVLALGAAQGGFVELDADVVGRYPFVSHAMIDAERGAHGYLDVTAS